MISQVVACFSLCLQLTNPLEGRISEHRIQGHGVNMRFGVPVHPLTLTRLAILQLTKPKMFQD